MIHHIVMFKLKERNPTQLETLVNALKGMVGKIETLRHLEVGVDYRHGERSYDLVLITRFDDRQGLETYAGHSVHQPVVELVRSLGASSVVVDYETD